MRILSWCGLLLITIACLNGAEAAKLERIHRYTNHAVPPWFDDRPAFSFVIDEEKNLVISSLGEMSVAGFCEGLKGFFCVESAIVNIAVPACVFPKENDRWSIGSVEYIARSKFHMSIMNSHLEVQKIEFVEKNRRGFLLFAPVAGVVGFYEEEGSSSDGVGGQLYLIEGAVGFGACSEKEPENISV